MVPRRMEDETTSARWRRWADESRQVARVWFSASRIPSGAAGWPARAGKMYDIFGTQSVFGEESLFLNFGYWENNPTTLDEASRDLARLVARSGDFNTSDIVVDCGTGYGDQDILWAKEFGVKHITGVNVAPRQIEISTRRVEEAGLADRIDYVRASATDLPQEDASCTKVVAL